MKCIENIAKLLIRFSETCEDDGSFDIGVNEAKALALLGYLNRPFRNRLFFELNSQGRQLIAAYNFSPSSRGEAVAYLHHIVDSTDGEKDLALSFSPDSFPFDSLEQYTSIKVEPLYTASGVVAGEVDEAVRLLDRCDTFIGAVDPDNGRHILKAIAEFKADITAAIGRGKE